MSTLTNLPPAVAESLAAWHEMIAAGDLTRLPSIIDHKAVFKSPMAHTPYESGEAVILILRTVFGVFSNFTYHRELSSGDGLDVVLEFSATVGDRDLRGIDLIRFDEAGKIVEFEVMVRPMSGLQALGAEMGKLLGQALPAFVAK